MCLEVGAKKDHFLVGSKCCLWMLPFRSYLGCKPMGWYCCEVSTTNPQQCQFQTQLIWSSYRFGGESDFQKVFSQWKSSVEYQKEQIIGPLRRRERWGSPRISSGHANWIPGYAPKSLVWSNTSGKRYQRHSRSYILTLLTIITGVSSILIRIPALNRNPLGNHWFASTLQKSWVFSCSPQLWTPKKDMHIHLKNIHPSMD